MEAEDDEFEAIRLKAAAAAINKLWGKKKVRLDILKGVGTKTKTELEKISEL